MQFIILVHESSKVIHEFLSKFILKGKRKLKVDRYKENFDLGWMRREEGLEKGDEFIRGVEGVVEIGLWTGITSHRYAAHLFGVLLEIDAIVG
jgi:hypothetical protein